MEVGKNFIFEINQISSLTLANNIIPKDIIKFSETPEQFRK
jgi:hypothetical protein